MTDERRKAFEDRCAGRYSLEQSNGIYLDMATREGWYGFLAALDYMESRLDSPEVVEAVSAAIEIEHQKPNRQYAKAALAALKGSI